MGKSLQVCAEGFTSDPWKTVKKLRCPVIKPSKISGDRWDVQRCLSNVGGSDDGELGSSGKDCESYGHMLVSQKLLRT